MLQRLKRLFEPSDDVPVNVNRLIRPFLSGYARAHGGSFMLLDESRDKSASQFELYCIFPREASKEAADYAKGLMNSLGLACQVFEKTHPELLNYLTQKASFIYERRSMDRKIA